MDNFWTYHTAIILIGFTFFPRLSLLFCNIPYGLFFWIGWFFLPRITIAILATIYYLNTNPILVIFAWLFALGGESAEKKYGYKMTKSKINNKIVNPEYEVINNE